MDNFSQEEKNEREDPARGKGACVGGRREVRPLRGWRA